MSRPVVHTLRVRYGECDPQGIVFNANYLLYIDVAVTELWRGVVGKWSDLPAQHGIDAVVAEANLSFRSPARFDDELELRAAVEQIGTTSMTTVVDVMRGDELLVEGTVRHVMVDTQTWRKTPVPDWIRAGFSASAT